MKSKHPQKGIMHNIENISVGSNSRTTSDKEKKAELKKSISVHGIIQPITIRPLGDAKFEVIAGHRRYEAAKELGLEFIPCFVQDVSEAEAIQIRIIENLMREDLSALDYAMDLKVALDITKLNQTKLAEQLGTSNAALSKSLKLLKLPEDILKFFGVEKIVEIIDTKDEKNKVVEKVALTQSHADVLSVLTDKNGKPKKEHYGAVIIELATEAYEKQLGIRELERRIKRYLANENNPVQADNSESTELEKEVFAEELGNATSLLNKTTGSKLFEGRLTASVKRKGNGFRITIESEALEDLEGVLNQFYSGLNSDADTSSKTEGGEDTDEDNLPLDMDIAFHSLPRPWEKSSQENE